MSEWAGYGIVHAGCWAHARRKFFDAVKLNAKDETAIGIVAQVEQALCPGSGEKLTLS
jgi:hypothetical protein